MLCLNHIEDRTFISLYKVHFLDYDLKQVQNKVFYKSDKKTCKCKTAPASSYHHLFPAWLTRTLRSNVFCLLLPAETTACYANRQEAPPPLLSSWRRAKHCCYCQRLSDKCMLRDTTDWAAATGADSSLCWKDGSLFATARDTFTNHSEIHFSHFPLSYTCAF